MKMKVNLVNDDYSACIRVSIQNIRPVGQIQNQIEKPLVAGRQFPERIFLTRSRNDGQLVVKSSQAESFNGISGSWQKSLLDIAGWIQSRSGRSDTVHGQLPDWKPCFL
mgnify:CR=1 FL=1